MERHGHSLAHLDIDIRAAAELAVVPSTAAVSVAAALLEQPSYHRQLLPPMKHSVRSWCIDGGLRGWVLNLLRPYHHATCPLAAHTVDARAIGGYHALVYRAVDPPVHRGERGKGKGERGCVLSHLAATPTLISRPIAAA